jgi:hypothetical protein
VSTRAKSCRRGISSSRMTTTCSRADRASPAGRVRLGASVSAKA